MPPSISKLKQGELFIVSTPIGNLEDISLRALNSLKEVDLIAAEDTRHTKKLLSHYGISKKVISYYQNKENAKAHGLLKSLNSGYSVALVSDAGTPGISDPGLVIIKEAINNGINVVPIPGASSLVAAISVSGLSTNSFIFDGFLPRKKGKRLKQFECYTNEKRTVIFFESPHRILKTLEELAELFPERKIVVAREITKKFEEFLRGPIIDVFKTLSSRKGLKGEFTLILEGNQ